MNSFKIQLARFCVPNDHWKELPRVYVRTGNPVISGSRIPGHVSDSSASTIGFYSDIFSGHIHAAATTHADTYKLLSILETNLQT